MQIVIDLPEKTINEIKDNAMFAGSISSEIRWDVTSAIVNSTPLPKGHGRLKDVDWIDDNCEQHYSDRDGSWCYTWRDIDDAPTIIEADKETDDYYRGAQEEY